MAVTAGASAPEHLVGQLLACLEEKGFEFSEERTVREEDVHFALPPELQQARNALTTITGG